jgi:hypothetical protein
MLGDRLVIQESLFYQFRLDDHVPADYLLRTIDRWTGGFAVVTGDSPVGSGCDTPTQPRNHR